MEDVGMEQVTDTDVVDVLQMGPQERGVAPGGWRRAVIGVAVGVAAGLAYLLADRLDGPARSGDRDRRR